MYNTMSQKFKRMLSEISDWKSQMAIYSVNGMLSNFEKLTLLVA